MEGSEGKKRTRRERGATKMTVGEKGGFILELANLSVEIFGFVLNFGTCSTLTDDSEAMRAIERPLVAWGVKTRF